MATTVENPFNTQQSTTSGIVNKAIDPATAGNTVAQYTPETRSVDTKTQTVAGQVDSMLAKDSPLLQRARTLATQGMAQRGLVNSSMSQGAGTAAMIDRVTPIAQQDAATYNSVASENMGAKNTAGQFNAGEQNRFGLQSGQQQFEAKQADTNRQFTTSERLGSEKFASTLEVAKQNFTSAQAQLDRAQQTAMADKSIAAQDALQKAQQTFTAAQSNLDRVQQTALQTSQQNFSAGQSALDRTQQIKVQDDAQAFAAEQAKIEQTFRANQSSLDRTQQTALTELQIKASNAQIPATFAANISNTTMTGVNSIMADGNMTAAAKQAAINNLITYANSQISWANKFYGSSAPAITAPAVK
jgi:hypothetical protein